jgi:hypothetical protein
MQVTPSDILLTPTRQHGTAIQMSTINTSTNHINTESTQIIKIVDINC